ncbi:MAG: hypothetical protein U5N56_05405 [Candidatus Marinimicrobia bacterium]|nr:hypothetical protein [Candidatus Neomarinimicrobiota bacterium]
MSEAEPTYLDMTLERDPNYEPKFVKQFKEQLYGFTFNTAVNSYNKVIRNESEEPYQ